MNPDTTTRSSVVETSTTRKRAFLNKFLTKTYHMLDQCPEDIASWSNGGDSFTIKNIDEFEKEVLPKYFNHSKFPSFIRQLNFYGFNKQRSDPDLQTHTRAVRFSHEFFRRGYPELLHKIQRTTASKPVEVSSSGKVESLQQQVSDLQHQLTSLESHVDERVEEATRSLEKSYLTRVKNLEQSYEALLTTMIAQYKQDLTAASYLTRLSPPLQPTGKFSELADYTRSTPKSSC